MAGKIIANERGIALLVTLAVTAILITASLEMNRRMRVAVFSAAATRDRITLLQMASAGIHAAQAILVQDKNNSDSDSLQEDWADPDKISVVLQDMPLKEGTVKVAISDELGKIQANSLVKFPQGRDFNEPQRLLWDRFLRSFVAGNEDLEETEPETIINSLKDWLDSGDDEAITGLSGAESDYYRDLDPPYACRNGPLPHIGELALVNGMTPELFEGSGQIPGISSYTTVYGMTAAGSSAFTYEGKININTADLPVLAALLPFGEEGLAEAIYEYRQEVSDEVYIHDLAKPNWYKDVPGLSDVKIDPDLITTSSDIFRIESVAKLNKMKMTITAVIKREKSAQTGKWGCKVLHWQAE
jgi:general secretion pathway protein K